MKIWTPLIAAAAVVATVQTSPASIVLQDNFDSSVAQENWVGDGVLPSIPKPGNVKGLPSMESARSSLKPRSVLVETPPWGSGSF
jgi:hypothetical protein